MIIRVLMICLLLPAQIAWAGQIGNHPDKAAIDRYIDQTWPKKAKFIKWVINRESGYDPTAKNGKCIGLMQINMGVWLSKDPDYNLVRLGIIRNRSDLRRAIPNIRAGVYILQRYNWDYRRYRGVK
jgi:hypothetical protein